MGESFNCHCEYFSHSEIMRKKLGKHLGLFITVFNINYHLILIEAKVVDSIQLILCCHCTSHHGYTQIPVTLFTIVSTKILCSDLETFGYCYSIIPNI